MPTKNSTLKESNINETFTENNQNNLLKSDTHFWVYSLNDININNIKYKIIKQLNVFSTEADLFLIESDSKQKLVLKYYRHNIKPKDEVLKILKSLNSKNVIKIIKIGQTSEGRFYEIQEFAEYGSLRDLIKNNESLSNNFIKEFIRIMNNCLNDLHINNLIHRDLKPANILIKNIEPLSIALTDFGISSVSEFSLHQTNLNRTILYSSPESMTGIISKASDYWSLGIIVLEMLLNKHPFSGFDDKVIIYTLATKNVPHLNHIKGEFEYLIKGLLARDDKIRWGYNEIDCWLNSLDVNTAPENINIPENILTLSHNIGSKQNNLSITSKTFRPYKFNQKDYFSIAELSIALSQNWSAAIKDFNSRKIRNWIVRELHDNQNQQLIESLIINTKLNDDEKLFEFLYKVNTSLPLIYKGFIITTGSLADLATRIFKKIASTEELRIMTELKIKKIIEKYCEICTDEITTKKFQPLLKDWQTSSNNLNELSQIVLINYSKNYKNKLIKNIIRRSKDFVVIRPIKGYDSIIESNEKINSIINEQLKNNYNTLDIIYISTADKDCFVSKEEANKKQEEFDKTKYLTIYLGTHIKLELVKIRAGTFQMGSNEGSDNEKPIHNVTIPQNYYMGIYPVTQEQWQILMNYNPSKYKKGNNYPVENLDWFDCQKFLDKLNELKLTNIKFRLPTEEEWEYACRAGTITKYYWGNEIDSDYCWYSSNSNRSTNPVGQKKPNAFGLYDMLGNVWEFCECSYEIYSNSAKVDHHPDIGTAHEILRGGSWALGAEYCTSSHRSNLSCQRAHLGFRIVLPTDCFVPTVNSNKLKAKTKVVKQSKNLITAQGFRYSLAPLERPNQKLLLPKKLLKCKAFVTSKRIK